MKYTPVHKTLATNKNPVESKHGLWEIIQGDKREDPRYPPPVSNKKLSEQTRKPSRADDSGTAQEQTDIDEIYGLTTTVNILLEKLQRQQAVLEEKIVTNIQGMVLPSLEKMRKTRLDAHQKAIMDILETNIHAVAGSFPLLLSSKFVGLTYSEILVADMVKQGHTSKDIAEKMNLSPKTIDNRREKIRKKLGINNKNISLRSFLLDCVLPGQGKTQ